jgi:uncharacterized membrane protein YeaQ/YmgE (transglycosylase-associated protein family)
VLLLGIIGFGILVGSGAQLLLGRHGRPVDWGLALVAGLLGSFLGGLIFSLLAGDGLALRPSGIIGSLVGAVIITAVVQWRTAKQRAAARAATRQQSRSGRHHPPPVKKHR